MIVATPREATFCKEDARKQVHPYSSDKKKRPPVMAASGPIND